MFIAILATPVIGPVIVGTRTGATEGVRHHVGL